MMNQDVPPLTGVLLIDKPVGPTSFRIVQQVRRALSIKKVGHAGTLDPLASGLLVVCVSRGATKHIDKIMVGEKEYIGTLCLGKESTTLDSEGELTVIGSTEHIDEDVILACLPGFLGEQSQIPPQYSAVKHKGKPLYHYARKGVVIEKEPRIIFIRELELLKKQDDLVTVRVVCAKGTYIRTLAEDIGRKLGCGAYLYGLRRTRSGILHVDNAIDGSLLADSEKAKELLLAGLQDIDAVLAESLLGG
ncbi:MAG: tRNA pseudouridine(55) synthase TruB [Desulfobulbaceae bacterium]|jgi:tRNA pseudouridine55 synthase|nr:tRNA pseudouridine(55) synthase TruB [Desulfobulbaceae bacterium]